MLDAIVFTEQMITEYARDLYDYSQTQPETFDASLKAFRTAIKIQLLRSISNQMKKDDLPTYKNELLEPFLTALIENKILRIYFSELYEDPTKKDDPTKKGDPTKKEEKLQFIQIDESERITLIRTFRLWFATFFFPNIESILSDSSFAGADKGNMMAFINANPKLIIGYVKAFSENVRTRVKYEKIPTSRSKDKEIDGTASSQNPDQIILDVMNQVLLPKWIAGYIAEQGMGKLKVIANDKHTIDQILAKKRANSWLTTFRDSAVSEDEKKLVAEIESQESTIIEKLDHLASQSEQLMSETSVSYINYYRIYLFNIPDIFKDHNNNYLRILLNLFKNKFVFLKEIIPDPIKVLDITSIYNYLQAVVAIHKIPLASLPKDYAPVPFETLASIIICETKLKQLNAKKRMSDRVRLKESFRLSLDELKKISETILAAYNDVVGYTNDNSTAFDHSIIQFRSALKRVLEESSSRQILQKTLKDKPIPTTSLAPVRIIVDAIIKRILDRHFSEVHANPPLLDHPEKVERAYTNLFKYCLYPEIEGIIPSDLEICSENAIRILTEQPELICRIFLLLCTKLLTLLENSDDIIAVRKLLEHTVEPREQCLDKCIDITIIKILIPSLSAAYVARTLPEVKRLRKLNIYIKGMVDAKTNEARWILPYETAPVSFELQQHIIVIKQLEKKILDYLEEALERNTRDEKTSIMSVSGHYCLFLFETPESYSDTSKNFLMSVTTQSNVYMPKFEAEQLRESTDESMQKILRKTQRYRHPNEKYIQAMVTVFEIHHTSNLISVDEIAHPIRNFLALYNLRNITTPLCVQTDLTITHFNNPEADDEGKTNYIQSLAPSYRALKDGVIDIALDKAIIDIAITYQNIIFYFLALNQRNLETHDDKAIYETIQNELYSEQELASEKKSRFEELKKAMLSLPKFEAKKPLALDLSRIPPLPPLPEGHKKDPKRDSKRESKRGTKDELDPAPEAPSAAKIARPASDNAVNEKGRDMRSRSTDGAIKVSPRSPTLFGDATPPKDKEPEPEAKEKKAGKFSFGATLGKIIPGGL